MKKIFIIFFIFFSQNASALYTSTIPNQCGNINKLLPIFTRNTYTCQSGYFLPANTDGCRACPNDHICSGGTFKFNERQSQGIVYKKQLTETATNACSANAPRIMTAVFEPNNVNLTLDYGTGNTSTTSCTYNELITLPPEPTRPGYTFTGWKVQRPNNNN